MGIGRLEDLGRVTGMGVRLEGLVREGGLRALGEFQETHGL